jgi:HlyD family secretion protein
VGVKVNGVIKVNGVRHHLTRLDKQSLRGDGREFNLKPGMQVTAEIHLGERTVMEYLLSPVQKAVKEAGRER